MIDLAEQRIDIGKRAFNAFVGWGISTLLLWLFTRNRGDGNTTSQQASKFTDSNSNQIGSAIPVVLGRALIKNPLISYYGDFRADIYTEEYGAHSGFNLGAILWPMVAKLIIFLAKPDLVVTPTGPGNTVDAGDKRVFLANFVIELIILLLMNLINGHLLRVTIQKGFKYYLGWQHIICWTGDNVGLKRIWMDVYDSNVEESTETGVWDNNNHIAWKQDNPNGIVAHIDDEDMFGGVDEGGGFVGDVRVYFGTMTQPNDSWMVSEMSKSADIPPELKGLTPKYPMYLTAVIPTAYIGKQATIPEMWFEVVNYPDRLYNSFKYDLQGLYLEYIDDYLGDVYNYLNSQSSDVKNHLKNEIKDLEDTKKDYEDKAKVTNLKLQLVDEARDALEEAELIGNTGNINAAKADFEDKLNDYNSSYASTQASFSALKSKLNDLIAKYPPTKKNEFSDVASPLTNLLDKGLWHLGRLEEDLNPAEAIYEILVNEDWGCDYKHKSRIDIRSLLKLGITCEEEGLGISALITNVQQASVYIDKILTHINGVKFDNPCTGKLEFKLIRNDYNVEDLTVFDTSNCISLEFNRLDWSETLSSISVNFTLASNKYETGQLVSSDIANRYLTGMYKDNSVDGSYFTTAPNAKWLADVQLLTAGYPLASVAIKCNRVGYNKTIGEPIVVNWKPYGIEKQVFRITDIDYACITSNTISIQAVEDVFGFEKTDYTFGDIPSWTEPEKLPSDVHEYMYLEMPYERTMSLDTYVNAYAAQPSADSIYWRVWRYIKPDYKQTNKAMTWSTVGRLVYGYKEDYPFDTAGFEFSAVGSNGRDLLDAKVRAIASDPSYNHQSGLNLAVIDKEIIAYDSIIAVPNGNYIMKGIVRGVYDTVPTVHTSGDAVFLLEFGLNVNGTSKVCSVGTVSNEQYEITTESINKAQDFDRNKVDHYTTVRRSEAPSIMANLQFGAERGTTTDFKYNYPASTIFSHDLKFKFIGRNKFYYSGILEQTDNTTLINVADDTKNVISVSCNGVSFELMFDARDVAKSVNIDDMTLLWSEYCKNMGARLQDIGDVALEIMTYDDNKGIYSYDKYVKNIRYEVPRLVGIVASHSDVQAYADTIVQSTIIQVPSAGTYPVLTLTYEECALIFVGNLSTTGYGFHNQVNDVYDIYDQAYRVDGVDANGKAIIHKVDIQEYYTIRTDFTATGTSLYYRYTTGAWSLFNIYI